MHKIVAIIGALAVLNGGAAEEGFVQLFDGKSLDGWKVVGGENKFSVEDGVIKGESVPSDIGINTFLMHDKEFANFDLKVEFNIESGNSGIQFRSFDRDREQFRPRRQVFGYQAEITPDGGATGRIYDEERRGYRKGQVWLDKDTPEGRLNAAKSGFKKGGWNEMRILCEDGHIRTWLNGRAVADFTDDVDRFGFIGLQVHYAGPQPKDKPFKPSVVRFRNIRIKELPPEKYPWSIGDINDHRRVFNEKWGKVFGGTTACDYRLLPDEARFDKAPGATKWTIALPLKNDARVRYISADFKDGAFVRGSLYKMGLRPEGLDAKKFAALREEFAMLAIDPESAGKNRVCAFYPAGKVKDVQKNDLIRYGVQMRVDPNGRSLGGLCGIDKTLGVSMKNVRYAFSLTTPEGDVLDLGVPGRDFKMMATMRAKLEELHPEKKGQYSDRDIVDMYCQGVITYRPEGK